MNPIQQYIDVFQDQVQNYYQYSNTTLGYIDFDMFFDLPHTAPTLTISITSDFANSPSVSSWGIRDFKLKVFSLGTMPITDYLACNVKLEQYASTP